MEVYGVVVVVAVMVAMGVGLQLALRAEEPLPMESIRNAARSAGLELVGEPRRPGWLEALGVHSKPSWWTADGTRVGPPGGVARSDDHGSRIAVRFYVASLRGRDDAQPVWVAVRWIGGQVDQVAFDTPLDRLR